MPPKTDAAAKALSAKDEAFLIACIKNGKEKLDVDFDRVATATGMSRGGVANKYRAIMKKFENEGVAKTSPGGGETPKKAEKTPTKRARALSSTPNVKVDGETGEDGDESPTKKVATSKAKAEATREEANAKETAGKSDEAVDEEMTEDEHVGMKKEADGKDMEAENSNTDVEK